TSTATHYTKSLSLHDASSDLKTLRQEFEATRRAGLPTELVSHAPGIRLRERISLKFPAQAQFNPRRYALGLSRAVLRHGAKIFTGTQAIDVDTSGATTTRSEEHTSELQSRENLVC